MFDKLSSVESQYEELAARLGTAEVQSDPSEYGKPPSSYPTSNRSFRKHREYKVVQKDIEGAEELMRGADVEMRELATEELKALVQKRDALLAELRHSPRPKGSKRREERDPGNPCRHRRRGGRALCGRLVPHVQPLCRASGLEARGNVDERQRHGWAQRNHRVN